MIVMNLFGGPGSGKSTTAAGVFAELKARGANVELAHEYAKELCWEKNPRIRHQLSIFAEQCWRIERLAGQVDFVVTDSPLLLSLVYAGDEMTAFRKLVVEKHNSYRSMNVFINRVKPYQPAGRYQDEAGAQTLDRIIRGMLESHQITYAEFDGNRAAAKKIANLLTEER